MNPEALDGSDDQSTIPPARKERQWQASARRWALELLIVFVGVYAAFALSEHQQHLQTVAHRDQIQQALLLEIEEITVRTRRAAETIPQVAAYYDSSIAAGGMPPLQPMIEPLNVHPHMWEAVLQSGGLNLLDVSTLYRISEFYNALNAGFEQLRQLRQLSEAVLIPNLDRGSGEFYDPVTKQLRPKYAWYPQGLRRVGDLAFGITELGDGLVADLKED